MNSDELLAQAEMGERAAKFRESELGKCILGMAKQDAEAAALLMAEVSAADTARIMQLQVELKAALKVPSYFEERITEGENAIQVFKQSKHEE